MSTHSPVNINKEALLDAMNDYPYSGDVKHFYNLIQSGCFDSPSDSDRLREAFPRQKHKEGGWTINPDYLEKIVQQIEQTDTDEIPDAVPSWEQIEMVLLAIEALSTTTEQPRSEAPAAE